MKLAKITQRSKSGMTKAFECGCGKEEVLGSYVFAHWNDVLYHNCECGRRNKLRSGVVWTPEKAPRKKAR